MHVVIVDGDVSYPPSSGKRLRTLHLMLRLARRHRLTYIARAHNGHREIRQAASFLGDHGIEANLLDDPLPRKNGPAFYARLAANLLSPLPYSAASHRSRCIREAVRSYAARHAVDLWQFEWTPYVATLPANTKARRLLMAHNVDSLIWQRYHENEPRILTRFYIRRQWRKFENFERRVFSEVDRVVSVSPEDAALLRRQFGVANVDVIENGVDSAYFENVGVGKAEVILFLGSLDWRPNLDAVRLLLDVIFPVVSRAEPSARLSLVGRSPPDWLVQRVAQTPNVELHPNVPDVRPCLAESGVLAVPLRIGGGSRLKILEALACGLPVVSTRIGAEGLDLQPDRELIVVERVEDMAAALIDAIRFPERMRRMAREGREVVRAQYDWETLAVKLERVWEKCVIGETRKPSEENACVSSS
jgi:polysaccharide biosynthesis protein PslH